ncbi:hypothetical protein YC2023_077661 [Brassica napus]
MKFRACCVRFVKSVLVVMVTWLASKVLGSHSRMLLMNLLDLSEGSFKDLTQKPQQICLLNRFAWGEKAVNDEECFVLMLETQPSGLTTGSKSGMETLKHTVWGCFSQRTGLLVQLEDTCLVQIKTGPEEDDVLWETTSETMIQGYKSVDGIQIAHRGRTRVSLLRLDESLENHSKTTMEESWEIEEVGFNVKGLSSGFLLPPGDLHTKEDEISGFNFEGPGGEISDWLG